MSNTNRIFNTPAFSRADNDILITTFNLPTDDISACAAALAHRLPAFGSVEGVPATGESLANAMRQFATEGPLLLVDAIWDTGRELNRMRSQIFADRETIAGVIFLCPAPGSLSPEMSDWLKGAVFIQMPRTDLKAMDESSDSSADSDNQSSDTFPELDQSLIGPSDLLAQSVRPVVH